MKWCWGYWLAFLRCKYGWPNSCFCYRQANSPDKVGSVTHSWVTTVSVDGHDLVYVQLIHMYGTNQWPGSIANSLHQIIAAALSLVDQLYSVLMVPTSCPQSADIHPRDPWEFSATPWWVFHLLPWYALVLSQSGCQIPRGTCTQNLSSRVAPCSATGELNWRFSIRRPAWQGWYVGRHSLVAASKHPTALFCVSPEPLWSPENWHRPTRSASGHPRTNLHGPDHPVVQSPQSQTPCAGGGHPSFCCPSPSWVYCKLYHIRN